MDGRDNTQPGEPQLRQASRIEPVGRCQAVESDIRDERVAAAICSARLVTTLSPREQQVFRLVGLGLSNEEICAVLTIEMSTTKRHVRAVLRKLQARDRISLVCAASVSGVDACRTDQPIAEYTVPGFNTVRRLEDI
jgi:DNA-binding NarL/FixJ family response regulator